MKTISKSINFIISVIIILLLGLIIFLLIKSDMSITKELIVGIATFLLALVPFSYYFISISKIEYKTFTACNRRFDDMNEILNEIIDCKKNDKNEYNLEQRFGNSENNKTAQQHILDYLDLCSEEYYLYKYSGIVPRMVWNHWFNGMLYYFEGENIFKVVLINELDKKRKDSYYGFLDFLIKKLKLKDK